MSWWKRRSRAVPVEPPSVVLLSTDPDLLAALARAEAAPRRHGSECCDGGHGDPATWGTSGDHEPAGWRAASHQSPADDG